MSGEIQVTVVGNLTDAPELRFTPNGAPVANFVIASTPRIFDRQANEFKDGSTVFLRCSTWNEQGENVASSLQRGTRVIAQGRLKSRSFETKEGEKRTVMELDVDEIGPSLRRATANVMKTQSGQGGYSQQAGGFGQQQQTQQSNGWGQAQQSQQSGWGVPPQ